MYVPVGIHSGIVPFLIDSGSSITLVSKEIFDSLPEEMKIKRRKGKKTLLLADGSQMENKGIVNLEMELGGEILEHEVHVADIGCGAILGLDFLMKHHCTLDWQNGVLKLGRKEVTLRPRNDSERIFRVKVTETVIIPSGHEVVVGTQLVRKGQGIHAVNRENSQEALLMPLSSFMERHDIVIAHSLVDAANDVIPLRVFNPTEKDVTLYKDSQPATLEPISEDTTVLDDQLVQENLKLLHVIHSDDSRGSEASRAKKDELLPAHLKELADRMSSNLSDTQRSQAEGLLLEFQNLFYSGDGQLGRTDTVKHKINTGDSAPIKQHPRRIPVHKQAVADKEIEKMLRSGVITPSQSPWASPIVLVRKKDGSIRFCVDYRKLNEVTIKDAYPIPRIEDSLDSLCGSQWFTTLDLASGYWQVEMEKEDREKTAFVTRKGLYEFTVMPFGLCNAPATFQRLMERVLSGLQWEIAVLYIDDIVVHGRSFEEHIERLRAVLKRLQAANLTLKTKKCCFLQQEVEFLGHIVSGTGISPNPQKVAAVANWCTPSKLKDLRSFLGLATYYRRFIKGFANIARPLHALTEKGKQFVWSTDCEEAFSALKNRLTSAPILAYPTKEDPFILDTDASQFGIGAVLSQKQSGEELVIAYGSRLLTKSERNYCTTRKELLAVVYFTRYFKHYLLGKKFLLRTDHGSLRWLFSFKEPEGQVARWIESLAEFEFDIEHRAGTKHLNADALSRVPCKQCGLKAEQSSGPDPPLAQSTPVSGEMDCQEESSRVSPVNTSVDEAQSVGLECLSKEEIRQEQLRDKDLKFFIELLEEGKQRPAWEEISSESADLKFLWSRTEQLRMLENCLYLRWEDATGNNVSFKLLVPSSLRNQVVLQLHDARTAGHLGFSKTWNKAKRSPVYWRNMRREIYEHCMMCHQCGSRKNPNRKNRAPMQQYRVGAPMERIAMDIAGPFPQTHRGNRFILVISDYFTKWTEAYALPDHTAETVANAFVEQFVCRFGTPREVFTDQGRDFESRLFHCMCNELGIRKTRTSPFHPQSDGMVERFNRTMECMLTSFVSADQRDWDIHLPFLTMAYRSTEHESTKLTPNMLMLGREIELPLDIIVGCTPGNPTDDCVGKKQEPHIQYAVRLREKMGQCFEVVRENLGKEMTRQKKHYDRAGKGSTRYKVGDPVWLHDPTKRVGLSPKLRPTWDGPYIIIKQLTDVTFRIQKGPRCKPKVVHCDRLKPYRGDYQGKLWWKDATSTSPAPNQKSRDAEVQVENFELNTPTKTDPPFQRLDMGVQCDLGDQNASTGPPLTKKEIPAERSQNHYNLRSRVK